MPEWVRSKENKVPLHSGFTQATFQHETNRILEPPLKKLIVVIIDDALI
jgi:hypothetical protein